MEWPAGRILLQWALDEANLGDATGTVLEIGSGIGVTSIGLALARQQEHGDNSSSAAVKTTPSLARVVATDSCDETLCLLRANVAESGLDDEQLRVRKWDAAAGEAALQTLPVPLETLTHVIGSDIVYHGFGESTDGSGRGLERTIAALLRARPSLSVRLLVVDRFSGGAVAALSGAAGVNQTSPLHATTVDPAVAAFGNECTRLGLSVRCEPVQSRVLERVRASQWPLARLYWTLCGFYDAMSVYSIELDPAAGGSTEPRREGTGG